ncbi:hypothetical protein tb265_49370 [Gemmatimonadetes bacterium T265]|nr:hypothetical protein tb265_49370 [Gemmatimonadetes bacterium T265]
MHYMLLLYGDQTQAAALPPAERGAMYAAYGAYVAALEGAGVLLHSGPLQPVDTATTVRAVGGELQVLDGPFAETKEQLAGYFLVDVPDLDAALQWARQCPAVRGGAVEVRPMLRIAA